MAALSRILNVLVIVAAAVALFVAISLNKHRQNARDRGDAYAKTIQDTAAALDKGSTTGVSGKVSNLAWSDFSGDPAAAKSAAGEVVKQAGAVIEQRDTLADRIVAIGASVDTSVDGAEIKNAAGEYTTPIDAIDARIAALKARDAKLAESVAKMGSDLGVKTEAADVLDVEKSETVVKSVSDKVLKTNQLYRIHVNTLQQIVEAAAPNLSFSDEDYAIAAPAKVNQLLENLGKLTAAMKENVNLKADNERLKDDNTSLSAQVETQTSTIADLEEKLAKYLGDEPPDKPIEIVDPNTLEGDIVSVNYDLNYVVIEFKAGVPAATTSLAVARDREFICNVEVTETFGGKFAVADILPHLRKGTVIPGDTALFIPSE